MTKAHRSAPKYPVPLNARVTPGIAEAVDAVRIKINAKGESAAVRRMLTEGARVLLGPNWTPGGKK